MTVVHKMEEIDKTNVESLEIKTRSIEQRLLPLVKQVTSVTF